MLEIKYVSQNENNTESTDKEEQPFQKIAEIDLNKCKFGDEYFFFEGDCGNPKYEDIEKQWEIFAEWIEMMAESKKNLPGEEAEYAYGLGIEVLKWVRRRDMYGIYILTRVHWKCFRDNYLTEETPEIVREFIDSIMYNQMTEKEMWGTDEDRKPSGKLLIVSDLTMTPEESYHLTMKEKRQKYDPKKHAERVKRDLNEMQKIMDNF